MATQGLQNRKGIISTLLIALAVISLKTVYAQALTLKYFHVNGNVTAMPGSSLVNFTDSYNSLASKPTADYALKITPGLNGTLLAGFRYKGSRNMFTASLFFGQSLISSDRNDGSKSPDWQSLNSSYVGTGIGYMGYLYSKKLGKSHVFPKLEYQLSLNLEEDFFRYTNAIGSDDKQTHFTPSATAFLQYNLYPPAEVSERRVGFGLNLKYHTTLLAPDLGFLRNDFGFSYDGSLAKNIGIVSAGISIIFLSDLPEKKKFQETIPFTIEITDAGTNRSIDGKLLVRNNNSKKNLHPSGGVYHLKKNAGQLPTVLVVARAHGFFSARETLSPTEAHDSYKIPLTRIRPEKSLATLYFQHATTAIVDSSAAVLPGISETLAANPDIKIIIKGHTSSEGSARKNNKLSRERAHAIERLLIQKGIAGHRIKTEGLGSTDPIFPDNTDEHRAYNRRVEIYILQ